MDNFKKYLISILIVELLACNSIFYTKTALGKEIKNQQLVLKEPSSVLENYETTNDVLSFKGVPLKYNDRGICILTYHCIGYEKNNGLKVPAQQFKQHMKYIKDYGYTTITLEQLSKFIIENKPIPEKSVVITFDDGYVDNYQYAYPILKAFNLKATVFVIPKTIDKRKGYMTSNQLKELQSNGIDIQSHTLDHEELTTLSYERQLDTLKESKKILENILDKKVNYIAYPYAKYNDNTIKAAKDAGYVMGFILGGRVARKNDGIYTLHRICVIPSDSIDVLKARLNSH
ncbi:polysaccharide deacetylase family protein [Clostridium estertheticum]|uniref:polysaccharide deacetylase family protein n=1 Tax=Clostridium estertheticum TaxID=238834 RepID=UPI0013E94745|nr:polysaccharide deacetylase family protein [Clostridium estertheticum]MBZ9686293.1 polysaccharide deacetylase family protein [Clostridium estertheticum]